MKYFKRLVISHIRTTPDSPPSFNTTPSISRTRFPYASPDTNPPWQEYKDQNADHWFSIQHHHPRRQGILQRGGSTKPMWQPVIYGVYVGNSPMWPTAYVCYCQCMKYNNVDVLLDILNVVSLHPDPSPATTTTQLIGTGQWDQMEIGIGQNDVYFCAGTCYLYLCEISSHGTR